ncbi:NAD(P)-dependent oxidoreductase [Umezawaea endophytica]|uniref:SDR family oxidoreductase n=1 Tax=Umezawaea endophytica TaxID=1654476 RepID=A0A9X3A1Z6_9PSEU|nr:NAD(P)-binding oxidoreductase [Umezawaea endophytica]MCS7478453.1 SDR family oxidoreductase [Umezawaea endophytica]
MKRIFVVGANGRLGRQVVARALADGHRVTAFVRNTAGLPDHPALAVATGSVAEQPQRVREAAAGHDAVVSALGNPLWLKGKRGPTVVAAAMENLVAAAVPRVVVPLAWGSGRSRGAASPLVRAVAATLIRRDYRDFDAAEEAVTTSGLLWTVAYFGALTDGDPTDRWRAATAVTTPSPLGIARADVARFLLDAVDDDSVVRRHVVLHGAK